MCSIFWDVGMLGLGFRGLHWGSFVRKARESVLMGRRPRGRNPIQDLRFSLCDCRLQNPVASVCFTVSWFNHCDNF